MEIDNPTGGLIQPSGAHARLPILLLYFDPSVGVDDPFLQLSQSEAVDIRRTTSLKELQSAIFANIGQMIVSVTGGTDDRDLLVEFAKTIVRRNGSHHSYVYLIVLLTGDDDFATIDALETLGARVLFRKHVEAIEHQMRLMTWRINNRPPLPVPCFYVRYPDADVLEVFLLGPIERKQLLYGEKLGELFEMLSVTRTWVTTRQIADELNIARSSVKVYIGRLREAYEENRCLAGVNVSADHVFCSIRHGGVWMHRLRGQVLIID